MEVRKVQEMRFKDISNVYCNAQMSSMLLRIYANPEKWSGIAEKRHVAPEFVRACIRSDS